MGAGGGKNNLNVSGPVIHQFPLSSARYSSWMGLVFFFFSPLWSLFSYLFLAQRCFIFIKVQLIYNFVFVSGVQQSDSVMAVVMV